MDLRPFGWLVHLGWVQPVCLVVLPKVCEEQKFQAMAFKTGHLLNLNPITKHQGGTVSTRAHQLRLCTWRRQKFRKVLRVHVAKPILLSSTAVAIKERLRVNEERIICGL
ncbi:unnamed protein product [Ectocarpus sp. 13 AM-2016]